MSKKTMKATEIVERYSVSRATLNRLRKQGKLTPTKVGKSVFFSVEELDRLFLGEKAEAA